MSEMKLSGYAVTYDPYPVHGGPSEGGWMEYVPRFALERAVDETPRLPLRIGDEIIGEAVLSVDDTGLRVDAKLDVGYGFRVKDQRWLLQDAVRKILSLSLEGLGVNVVVPS